MASFVSEINIKSNTGRWKTQLDLFEKVFNWRDWISNVESIKAFDTLNGQFQKHQGHSYLKRKFTLIPVIMKLYS